MKEFKKTKIVASLGPSSNDKEIIHKMIDEGVNVFRLNFSHGDHEEHGKRIKMLKELIDEGHIVGIMGDTKGPEIRTGLFKDGKAPIKKGDKITIVFNDILGDVTTFSTSYNFYSDVKVGDHIKIDDGSLDLIIEEKDSQKQAIIARALNTHTISNRKGVNLPFVKVRMPFISKRDEEDIKFMVDNDVDFIAASFTRTSDDVKELKKLIAKFGKPDIKVIAKIENQEGVDNILSIIQHSDGIMVARGDLGVEVPAEEVPYMQKQIINACFTTGKPVIIATQMLDSMQRNPVPTRAEVSDVANAIFDNGDAVMLSGETASGEYPLESVMMQARIAKRIETLLDYSSLTKKTRETNSASLNNAIANAVAEMTETLDVKLVVAMTSSGSTPKRIAKFRPRSPIIAVCDSLKVARALQLTWGVYPHLVSYAGFGIDDAVILAKDLAKSYEISKGCNIVITGGAYKGTTDYMKVIEVE
jgi:pyruvate kinase